MSSQSLWSSEVDILGSCYWLSDVTARLAAAVLTDSVSRCYTAAHLTVGWLGLLDWAVKKIGEFSSLFSFQKVVIHPEPSLPCPQWIPSSKYFLVNVWMFYIPFTSADWVGWWEDCHERKTLFRSSFDHTFFSVTTFSSSSLLVTPVWGNLVSFSGEHFGTSFGFSSQTYFLADLRMTHIRNLTFQQ